MARLHADRMCVPANEWYRMKKKQTKTRRIGDTPCAIYICKSQMQIQMRIQRTVNRECASIALWCIFIFVQQFINMQMSSEKQLNDCRMVGITFAAMRSKWMARKLIFDQNMRMKFDKIVHRYVSKLHRRSAVQIEMEKPVAIHRYFRKTTNLCIESQIYQVALIYFTAQNGTAIAKWLKFHQSQFVAKQRHLMRIHRVTGEFISHKVTMNGSWFKYSL